MQLFVNGVVVMQSTEIVFLTTADLTLDGLFFSTFFGGDSPVYAPSSTQYSYFRGFKVYRYNY